MQEIKEILDPIIFKAKQEKSNLKTKGFIVAGAVASAIVFHQYQNQPISYLRITELTALTHEAAKKTNKNDEEITFLLKNALGVAKISQIKNSQFSKAKEHLEIYYD